MTTGISALVDLKASGSQWGKNDFYILCFYNLLVKKQGDVEHILLYTGADKQILQ